MLVTALGRLNLAIAGKFLQEEFRFTNEVMGWILGAFAFGYALFQIPCGWAGDRYGPHRTLTLAILWWSTLTVLLTLVPLAVGNSSSWRLAWAFMAVRLLTGAGEAASYPNANKIVANWMTEGQRGIGSSLLLGGVGAGGVLAPIMFTGALQRWGWRSSFLLSGILAILLAIIWSLYSTNRPEEHPSVNAAELKILGSSVGSHGTHSFRISGPPWQNFFASSSVWALIASYFCHGYTPYIYYTWFFIYLTSVRGLTIAKGGLWGSTPFIAMTLMAPLGGWLSDKAVAHFGRRRGRQSTVWFGMTCSALLLCIGSHTVNNTSAILLLAVAAGFSHFAAPSWWATCIDLTPEHAGSLSGLMNTCANLAGGIAPISTAYIATKFGWTAALDFAALVSFCGGLIWVFVNAADSLEVGSKTQPTTIPTSANDAGGRPVAGVKTSS
jgi:ACS family glucarate transporter-like MFS transporter